MRDHHSPVDLDEAGLSDLLFAAAGRLRRASFATLEPYGLSPHHARALRVIDREGTLRPSDLAAELRIAPRSATDVVDVLVDKGLVGRAPSATDRRAVELTTTDAGRSLAAEIRRTRAEAGDVLSASLSAADRRSLTELLRKALRE
ncbi:MarR family winged helix-turn-helix transcriptional regulator [Calidifontibacter terrae]